MKRIAISVYLSKSIPHQPWKNAEDHNLFTNYEIITLLPSDRRAKFAIIQVIIQIMYIGTIFSGLKKILNRACINRLNSFEFN